MVLPHETGQYYLEEPKEHGKRRYPFLLSPEGQWVWVDPSTNSELTSQGLATSLLNDLLQMYDDVETGRVKQPAFD
jgi:hypothetical protein